ncbi:hypothetical protein HRM2_25250 [Desulforapulum autotrophicum HRM2]|uniref:DNA methylase N-4/N-6 domain-containing protein n=1 Tax=Desulforapulum autotrophicum (strain ATCC 43914 / DSM 3382 / VKM B-1955 / HRM2) TaxID=177437 RepID=C0QGX0_DESAH|nr:helix-turn-helix transcriptional regulator [Desulforapulum autotrophicum]ACN15619.1 hypothetical protein HRM2_25250 [Desulforapulum autotrophicum HRM2]
MKVSDLTWDPFIYPRANKSQKTITAYVEALGSGAQFPPIKVQRVFNYDDGDRSAIFTLVIDGIHRWFAFQEKGIKAIEVVEWQTTALDYKEHKTALLLESAVCNISHGDRLNTSDKKRTARVIAESDPESKWTESALAEKLGVRQQTVNGWISDIRARQKTNRNSTILRLSRLGWIQEKISDVMGVSQNRISEIIGNTIFGNFDNLIAQGHDMEYIARHFQMDLSLAWALRLTGKKDQEKFKALGWGLRTWDQWSFNECDQRFGEDWPGRIPAQLVAHTLFYYTKPGDLVLDPMAGGGVVPDVCLIFERKCQAFDLATQENRPEIEYHHWNPQKKKWPATKKPDLIFFDPPYFTKKKKAYKEKATRQTPSISSYKKKDYEQFFRAFFLLARENTKQTRMAFLNADWYDFESTPAPLEDPDKSITIFDFHRLLSKTGWRTIRRIETPLSSARMSGNQVQKMQNLQILGTTGRTLLIAKKV